MSEEPSPLIKIIAGHRKQIENRTPRSCYPRWLLVNRQILNEAMGQFFRNLDWQAKIPSSYSTTRIVLSNTDYQLSILSDMHLELLDLPNKCCTWIPDEDYSHTTIEVYKAWPMHLPILKKLEPCLRTTNGQRTLHVTFGIWLSHATKFLGVDLSMLEEIGFTVDKVVTNVACMTAKTSVSVDRVRLLLSEEIKRMGGAMIDRPVSFTATSADYGTTSNFIHWTFEVMGS